MSEDLDDLVTEASHPASEELDRLPALDIVRLMNREDGAVVAAVESEAEHIARGIEWITEAFASGGRLLYAGAGTSGRLGVLDAAECPPTFGTPPEMVVGVIAGGSDALTRSVEGAEDDRERGAAAIDALAPTARDVVVGIAASGRTPWVLGAVARAGAADARSIGVCCNPGAPLAANVDLAVVPVVGPEILAGSTRLKAGTATKMVLNMFTTGAMVGVGKTFGNRMVDVCASNDKLRARALRIVRDVTDLPEPAAADLLTRCDGEVKTALLAHRRRVSAEEARLLLERADGHLRRAIDNGEPS